MKTIKLVVIPGNCPKFYGDNLAALDANNVKMITPNAMTMWKSFQQKVSFKRDALEHFLRISNNL